MRAVKPRCFPRMRTAFMATSCLVHLTYKVWSSSRAFLRCGKMCNHAPWNWSMASGVTVAVDKVAVNAS